MKALHTWNNNDDSISKTIHLYKDKVVIIKHFDNNQYTQTFTFNEFLEYKYTIVSAEIDCQILKKIEEVELEKTDGIRGDYFKIIDGKVIVGGWDNPKDGGENYSSVEYLWYNIKERLQKDFHDKEPYIIHTLEKAIIDETFESNYKLKTAENNFIDETKPSSAGEKTPDN